MSATLCPHDLSEHITEMLLAQCRISLADHGIGSYECHGARGYDRHLAASLDDESAEIDVTGIATGDLRELGAFHLEAYAPEDEAAQYPVHVEAHLWCFDRRDGKTFAVYTLRDAS